MDTEQNHQRIKTIYRMLLEMATGNLAFRIKLDGEDHQFDEVAQLLNEVAEKMQMANYLNPNNFTHPILTGNDAATVIIQKVQDYILNNLEEPLPTTKELSKMFGTNEFFLKDHFRKTLKTSIYQFYNDERLKKAHFLIEKTTIPLKEISFLCGFNDYTNFFKAFRKKYKYAPSDLSRNKNDN
ncbi:MAG TPA: AraC family transcriptional regulator [Flavobacterium sp.]|uniref:AraC family transcriptional regulator n=1 Tax=Flavobacterium sp. TaxID=239 RepID=UPI002C3A9FC6|nr:AraC family transcriptional regulator [Flavobacterium sp.]HNP33694.1 AraC family transcriptional regulator [Flavobacterium sp.]